LDFYRSLRSNPAELKVLGDGTQRKSYLYIHDCIDAIFLATTKANAKVNILNLGTDEHCTVKDSIGWICEELKIAPRLVYSGGSRGWIGDNPFIYLDCAKIRALGWRPKLTIRQGVVGTLRYLQSSPWLLEPRER
jgi:UDP-glucose 4-epimerase